MMLKFVNVTFLTLYCSLIFWLSSQPSLPAPALFLHQDKVHHLGAYFIMGILAWRFFADYVSNTNAIIALSIGYCSLYGLSDEWHQSFVPGREADFLDWLADTLGALAAALTIQLKNKLFKSRKYTD